MRSVLRLVTGALLGTVALNASAAEAPSTFKISAIIGLSGPLAVIGADMRRGVEVALEERGNRVGGVPIEITWDDSEGKPQVAVQKASQRIAQGTHMVFGEIASPQTIALSNVTEQREVPLLVTFAADNALTTPGRLKWTFRTGKNVSSTVLSTAGLAAQNKVTKMFGITPDYDAARDSWNVFKTYAGQHNIQIVGEEFHPTPNRDFSILIDKAIRSGADGLFITSQGSDAITLLKQGAEVGLKDKMKLFGGGVVDETIMKAVGAAGVDVGSTIRYHWIEDFPANLDHRHGGVRDRRLDRGPQDLGHLRSAGAPNRAGWHRHRKHGPGPAEIRHEGHFNDQPWYEPGTDPGMNVVVIGLNLASALFLLSAGLIRPAVTSDSHRIPRSSLM